MKKIFAVGLCAVALFAGSVSAQKPVTVGGAPMYPNKNIIENAVNSKDHTTLVAAVKAAGLVETLQGAGPFTVFAPVNDAFAAMLGCDKSELVGQTSLAHFADRESWEAFGAEAYKVLATGRTYVTERLFKRKDGSLFWCQVSGNAVDPADLSKGSIWVNIDISERRRAEEEIRRALEKEKELNELGKVLAAPKKHFVGILGGSKVEDKLGVIQNLLPKVETLLIGGGMAFTFFKAQGLQVYAPDVAAFRAHAQKKYLESAMAKDWPKGMLDRINALK